MPFAPEAHSRAAHELSCGGRSAPPKSPARTGAKRKQQGGLPPEHEGRRTSRRDDGAAAVNQPPSGEGRLGGRGRARSPGLWRRIGRTVEPVASSRVVRAWDPAGARGSAGGVGEQRAAGRSRFCRKEGGGGRGSGWGGVECAERTKSPTAGDVADLGRRATGRNGVESETVEADPITHSEEQNNEEEEEDSDKDEEDSESDGAEYMDTDDDNNTESDEDTYDS
ncbi:hypothetical protein OsI_16483 [Oryza sativa Indica Group]|uniref:Uncharacterized protein n=1 Tax=Oryza sativa subsp. indica TaxID=39946 RepID=B8AR91_ORYSI|nr:hypothetical protein OsI_16483 [Oryza sativa Indica Group]